MRDKDLKNRVQSLYHSTANERQRFSIRKLSIGAASVLLGTAFLFGAGTQVQAAENQNGGVEATAEISTKSPDTTVDDSAKAEENNNSNSVVNDKNGSTKKQSEVKTATNHESVPATTQELKTSQNKKENKKTQQKQVENKGKALAESKATTTQNTTTYYGHPLEAANNPAAFNEGKNNPDTNQPYPVKKEDLQKDFTFKRTINLHEGNKVSTVTEWINGQAYPPAASEQTLRYYRNASVNNDTGEVTYSKWTRLNRFTGEYEPVSSKKIPAYQLPAEMTDASGKSYTAVPEAAADDEKFGAGSVIDLYAKPVTVTITYQDAKTRQNLHEEISTIFQPQENSDGVYKYSGYNTKLTRYADTAANYSLLNFLNLEGTQHTLNSVWVDNDSYTETNTAKAALKTALSDSKSHNITIFVNSKYQLTLNLYNDDTKDFIKVPASDPAARYMKPAGQDGKYSVYTFPVTGNQYVVDLTKLQNFTMTDQSLQAWNNNFEKHSNGYWYTKSDMDKPLTLTLHYKNSGKYSFVAPMRDTDGNQLPSDYTHSLGSMYRNGSYVYAQMKPGAYVNDLTKFKLDNSHEYDYYLTADSLANWEKYFEKHSNGYWYAKSNLKDNINLNLTYNKVQKHNIKLTLVDTDTGDAIVNNAEKTTPNGRGFAAHMNGNVYSDYATKAGFAQYLLHMPGYELTEDSKAQLEDFLAKPYVEEDFTGTLEYKKLAPIHVVGQDNNGNVLFKYDITTKNAQVGNPYEVNVLNVPGYKLVKDENNNGEVSTTAPTVTFTYEKDPTSNEGTWIKDYKLLTPGIMLPDQVGTIGVPNGKYDVSFDDAQAENIKYYQEHGYTYLGAANAFKVGQQWYPLSWIKATFVPNQGVTVHYYGVNEDQSETQLHDDDYLAANPKNPDQTNHGINEDQFYYPEGSYTATPKDFGGWTLIGIRDSKGNFTKLNYDNNNLVLAAGVNSAPLGQINGEYLPFAQDITYIYAHVPVKQTEEKTAKRTIHYVANSVDGEELQPSSTQSVTVEGTYYISPTDPTKRVGIKTIKIGGQDIVVVDPSAEATETWTVKSINDVTQDHDHYVFGKKNKDTITVDDAWSHDHANVATGTWHHVASLDQNNTDQTIGISNWPKSLDDVYLVYKQKAHYNIHYVDVTGLDKTHYEPSDDTEARDLGHTVTGIGNDTDGHVYYVGDTPNVTDKLWNTYEDEGYVLVQADPNLGKQILTTNTPDQYVYLVKKAKHHTDSKTIKRKVNFVTENDHQALLNPTTESVKFTQDYDYYLDKNGKEVIVTTKKLNGVDVVDKILTGDDAEAAKAWKSAEGNQAFASVDIPEITNGKIAGDWVRVNASHDKNSAGNVEGPELNGQKVQEDSLKNLAKAENGADQVYTIYYAQKATEHKDSKTVKRIVHFVTEDVDANGNHKVLLDPTTESVTFSKDYFTALDKDGKTIFVNAKELKDKDGNVVKDSNGKTIYVVDYSNTAAPVTDTWKQTEGNGEFVQKDWPEITNGKIPGTWERTRATRDNSNGKDVVDGKIVPADSITAENIKSSANQEYTIYYNKKTNPTQPTQPTDPTSPTQPTQPAKPEKKTPKKHKHYNENVNAKYEVVKDKKVRVSQLKANNLSKLSKPKAELPQTGEENNQAGLIGMLVATLGGLTALFGISKKRKD